jgi:hypothetical protein
MMWSSTSILRSSPARIMSRVTLMPASDGVGFPLVWLWQDDGGRRQTENLTRMYEDGVLRPGADHLMAFDPAPRIEQADSEALTIWVEIVGGRNMHPPIVGGGVGRMAKLQVLGGGAGGAFAKRNNLVFVGLARGCEGRHERFASK